jgi:integrase
MWQSPAIFLQQAISASVIVEVGRQASAGVAVQTKTRAKANGGRHFAMTRCYILKAARVKRCGELEQIQFLLGHTSVQTTERYLSASRTSGTQ